MWRLDLYYVLSLQLEQNTDGRGEDGKKVGPRCRWARRRERRPLQESLEVVVFEMQAVLHHVVPPCFSAPSDSMNPAKKHHSLQILAICARSAPSRKPLWRICLASLMCCNAPSAEGPQHECQLSSDRPSDGRVSVQPHLAILGGVAPVALELAPSP